MSVSVSPTATRTVSAVVSDDSAVMSGRRLARLVEDVHRDRDRAAFAQLFEHFAPRLKSFYLRQGVNESLAEDLVQESMLVLWHRAGEYQPQRAAVSTWLFTIARNMGIDRLRRERRYDAELPPEDALREVCARNGVEADAGPQAALETAHREAAVKRALRTLSDDQRRMVEMHYSQWMTTGEIAEHEDLPQGTVKSRLRLALKRLRPVLEDC